MNTNKPTYLEKSKTIIFFIFIMSLFLIAIGSYIGIFALDSYLKHNNYVLCNIDDLKKANDILNGNIYETKPQLIVYETTQKPNSTYKSPFAKEWCTSKEVS